MKSQLRVLCFQHLKNGMPFPSGFHGFSRQIHCLESLFSYSYCVVFLWLPSRLLFCITAIWFWCTWAEISLGLPLFEFSEPLEFVCLFLFSKLRGFQPLFLQKIFSSILFFLSGILLTQKALFLFFPFYLSLFFILNKFIHLPLGQCFPMYYLFCHWSNRWPPFRGKVLFLGLFEVI